MRIAIVDREPVVVAALRSFMGEHGHEVSTADSVHALLSRLKHGAVAPDLILVDFKLATNDASFLDELCRSHPGARVVIMATEGAALPAGAAVATDASAYLRKPIRFTAVEDLLRQMSTSADASASDAGAARSDSPATDVAVPTRVLVVDDSPLIHAMYRTILRQRYPTVTIFKAMNGREALDLLATDGGVDLVLLDINMPVMNGIQFLDIFSANLAGGLGNLPVIVVTTEGKEEDAIRGLRRGARGYLVKPFRAEVLCQLIETVLKKERARGR